MTACADNPAARQAEVRELGEQVMPFDLDATRHSFVSTDDGGVQTVLALDVYDDEQIALVRQHLTEIAADFGGGAFTDPASIHGDDMPGLATLRERHTEVDIIYADVRGGGQITYRSGSADVVDALHAWFAAQLHDHGADAVDHPMHHDEHDPGT